MSEDHQSIPSVEQWNAMVADLKDIKRCLVGDKEYGPEGVVDRLTKLEVWKTTVTLKMAGVAGAATTAGFLVKHFFFSA